MALISIKGAKQAATQNFFDDETNFVDLHLDFPVRFGKYVPGMTPFMMASMRCEASNDIMFFKGKMDMLNEISEKSTEIKRILSLFRNKNRNEKLYREKIIAFLKENITDEKNIACKKPIDQSRVLYLFLDWCFLPFNNAEEIYETVTAYTNKLISFAESKKEPFESFLNELIDTNFLNNLQDDCLQIYPKILNFELVFRPAIFLDFDNTYHDSQIAYRVSSHDFEEIKDLYKDISEVLSRQLVLIAALNNIDKRGDFNSFANKSILNTTISKIPTSIHEYADVAFGSKLELLDTPWYNISKDVADNQLRNSIAHFKAEYDDITQKLTYFPKREGIKQEKSEEMYFLDFSRKILLAYREMHKLNHLIRCLYNFHYLFIKPE